MSNFEAIIKGLTRLGQISQVLIIIFIEGMITLTIVSAFLFLFFYMVFNLSNN